MRLDAFTVFFEILELMLSTPEDVATLQLVMRHAIPSVVTSIGAVNGKSCSLTVGTLE